MEQGILDNEQGIITREQGMHLLVQGIPPKNGGLERAPQCRLPEGFVRANRLELGREDP